MTTSKIGIVIPILNQFQLAVEAIESIRTASEYKIYPILNYRENLSLSGAWNLGAYKAITDGCTHILIINDDILFSRYTIDAMKSSLDKLDDTLLISGSNLRGSMQPHEIYTYTPVAASVTYPENPDFACFMITPQTIDIVGNFDEKFNPAYFEDNDYHRRINLSGYHARSCSSAGYYHYGSQTQNKDRNNPVVPPFIFEINRGYYISKWGGEPGMELYLTPYNDPDLTWRHW